MSTLAWTWDGEAMRPMRRFVEQADRELVVGERYVLEPVDEAQSARDRAYHAEMREAWLNLPHDLAEQFPNPTDFRRFCLIETGFCDIAKLAFASSRAALAALPFLQIDGAIVGVKGAVAVVKKPWSQKLRGGMKREDRIRSYKDTLDFAASLIGATSDGVARNARGAA